VLQTLRSRRYLGLFGAVLVVAMVCILAGTWQVVRFEQKRQANHELRANNKAATVEVGQAMGPASAPIGNGKVDKFRHVTATGQYLASHEVLVRGQTVGSDVGYLVLTPFKTSSGVLLVVRGFVGQTQAAAVTPIVTAPPAGTMTINARLEPADTRADRLGRLPKNQVESINPASQQARLDLPVWDGYGELLAGQPGTADLTVIPAPDMSNPAGGADEPQHAAYVVQWYLFAGLALALPFVLASAERRRDAEENPADPNASQTNVSKKRSLDDRLAGNA
jgi:cytochrome oxidase assembly protein ShyY1